MLWLMLDGVPDGPAEAHLRQCPTCTARAARLAVWDRSMTRKLARMDCPPAQRLADLHAGFLTPDEQAAVEQHLASCPRCQEEVAMMKAFIAEEPTVRVVPRPEPPSVVRPPKSYWQAELIERPSSAAMRGFDQLHFDARAHSSTLYLEAQRAAPGAIVNGQIIDAEVDWIGALAELWQNGSLRGFCVLDDLCEFTFRLPAAEPISLYVTGLGGVAIALEHVSLADLNP
jgi:hypothetical protein